NSAPRTSTSTPSNNPPESPVLTAHRSTTPTTLWAGASIRQPVRSPTPAWVSARPLTEHHGSNTAPSPASPSTTRLTAGAAGPTPTPTPTSSAPSRPATSPSPIPRPSAHGAIPSPRPTCRSATNPDD